MQGVSNKLVKMDRQRVDNRVEVIAKAHRRSVHGAKNENMCVIAVQKHGLICPDRLQLKTKINQFPLKPSLRLVNEEYLKIIFADLRSEL